MYLRRMLFILFIFSFFADIAQAVCVNVPRVSLRSGPGPKYKETWKVGKYTPLKRKGDLRNGWMPVTDMDGESHWVYSSAVTEEYECVSVKADFLVLRAEPQENGAVAPARYADKYWPAKKIRMEDDWIHLEDDFGNRYWVKENRVWRPLIYSQISF